MRRPGFRYLWVAVRYWDARGSRVCSLRSGVAPRGLGPHWRRDWRAGGHRRIEAGFHNGQFQR